MKLTIQPILLDSENTFGVFSYLKPVLETVFEFNEQATVINTPIAQIPTILFDSSRNQYLSDQLLSWLQQTLKPSKDTKVLAVCDFDAYFGKYNFCFGEAIIGGRVAAVYLQRLLPQDGNGDNKVLTLLQDRLIKEAIHELGHTFGLRHCSLGSCIMYKSKTILDTDIKRREFCKICICTLANSIGSHSK